MFMDFMAENFKLIKQSAIEILFPERKDIKLDGVYVDFRDDRKVEVIFEGVHYIPFDDVSTVVAHKKDKEKQVCKHCEHHDWRKNKLFCLINNKSIGVNPNDTCPEWEEWDSDEHK